MKIDAADPRWASIAGPYASALPPASVNNGKIASALAALSQNSCVHDIVRDGAQLGARAARVVATTSGWPQPRIAGLDALISSASRIIPENEIAQAIATGVDFGARQIVGLVLDEIDSALSNLTGVPILGWVVGIGRVVWKIVEQARARAPQMADTQALAYDRDRDSYSAQAILDIAANQDWSKIWMPPSEAFAIETLAYTASGIADGRAWGQLSGLGLGGVGALPGVAEFGGYWQSPRNMIGSSREADHLSIQSQATLLPSTTSLCGQLWCAVQKGGLATTGRVDFKRIEDAWRDYTIELLNFAGDQRIHASKVHGYNDWIESQIIRGWSWSIAGENPLYGIVRDKVPAKFRIGLLDRIVAWRCEQARWATRQAWHSTPSVAYVREDAPALADPGLKESWKVNRQRLLGIASLRIGLDLDLVPQGEYRSALAKLPIPQGRGGSTGGMIPLGVASAPPGSGMMHGVSMAPPDEGGGGALVLIGGLGLLALIRLLR